MLSNPNGGDVVEVSMEKSAVRRLAGSSTKFVDLGNEARIASDAEHSMTVREAARMYPQSYLLVTVLLDCRRYEGATTWSWSRYCLLFRLSLIDTGLKPATGAIKIQHLGRPDSTTRHAWARSWVC